MKKLTVMGHIHLKIISISLSGILLGAMFTSTELLQGADRLIWFAITVSLIGVNVSAMMSLSEWIKGLKPNE